MNIFKSIFTLLICAGLASCTGEKPDEGTKTYSILFTENPVMVGSDEGTFSSVFVSEHQWTAAAVESWISDVSVSGNEFSFTIEANPGEEPRDGKIRFTVSGDDFSKDLVVRQAGFTGRLTVEASEVTISPLGETREISVTSAGNWSVTSVSGDWLTVEKKNSTTLQLKADANYSGSKMTADVLIQTSSGRENATLKVTQTAENSAFAGAATPETRRFVHRSAGLVSQVTAEKTYSIGDCVNAMEMQFTSKSGSAIDPYSIFVFEVDLTKDVTILASCVNDDPASIKTTDQEWTEVATMRDQFYAMQTKRPDIDLLCGVNGDFCYGHSSYGRKNLLHGIMYKDGQCLKNSFDGGKVCTIFAVLKDGTAKILTQDQYPSYKSDLAEAIGGRQHLLTAGQRVETADKTKEPRTAVGVTRDGKKVILLIVDGRRSGYSVGADYHTLSTIFLAYNVTDAINLDGGGSSTFLIKNASASKGFETRNRPTDNTGDRAIPNGLAVVRKK